MEENLSNGSEASWWEYSRKRSKVKRLKTVLELTQLLYLSVDKRTKTDRKCFCFKWAGKLISCPLLLNINHFLMFLLQLPLPASCHTGNIWLVVSVPWDVPPLLLPISCSIFFKHGHCCCLHCELWCLSLFYSLYTVGSLFVFIKYLMGGLIICWD